MNIVKSIAVAIVVATSSLLFVSATVQAYDFANVCPAQAPPKWVISVQAWTQFVNSCIANDAAATAGRAFDRPLWDKCIEKCGLADDAEGRTPPRSTSENQTSTSGSPANPSWCADVPASPPPPNFELKPGNWAATRKMCMNAKAGEMGCGYICGNARERWHLWKLQQSGQLKPNAFPPPTDKPQGPFPVPGGGSGFILPMQPAPAPSGPTSDAADALSAALSSVVLPPGPFSSFPGQDLSATASGQGQPPNVSADVSSTQNAEFINFLGLWVWNKPTLPIVSPPTPIQKISLNDFWCDSYGVNGQPLNGCVNGQETFGTFGDTQIGYDATLERWIATTNASDGTSHIGVLYFAVSESSTLSSTGGWNKWWASTCNSSPYTAMDEPLLGWSNSVVVVDVTCFQGPANEPTFGPDNLFVISNVTITSVSQTLPTPMVAPCAKMAPARDEQGTLSNAYLLTSIVPNSGFQATAPNCAPSSSNTEPYAVEYTANASGVFGSSGCAAGTSGCSPVSTSFQWGSTPPTYNLGSADQSGCGDMSSCEVTLGDARVTAAQIRPTNISGISYPVLTFGFGTGVNAGSSGPQSQNVWFLQNLSTASWLSAFNFAGGSQWYAFPTIAIDADLELYLGSTQFTSSSFPSTIWDSYAGLSFVGQNFIEIGTAEYTGNSAQTPPVRWGDYNTMVFDPYAIPPGGEGSWWSVEEISQGGSDQLTNWEALADPTPVPYFVSDSSTEAECAVSPGQNCVLKIPAPAGLQNGDVVVAFLNMGGSFPTPPTAPDSTWITLSIANQGGAQSMDQGDCKDGDLGTEYAYAHVYGSSSETGTYDFKHVLENICSNTVRPELSGFLAAYRAAATNLANLVLFGYPENGSQGVLTDGPASSNMLSEGKLLNVFNCPGSESPESEEGGAPFSSPLTGTPPAMPETSFGSTPQGYFLADVGVPAAGTTLGQYGIGCFATGTWGWQLFLPQ